MNRLKKAFLAVLSCFCVNAMAVGMASCEGLFMANNEQSQQSNLESPESSSDVVDGSSDGSSDVVDGSSDGSSDVVGGGSDNSSNGGGVEHTHSWDDGRVTTEPTCTAKGVKIYSCGTCRETYTEDIPMLQHTYVDGECVCGRKVGDGLEYTLNKDGSSYSVTGSGTCTDEDIVIPSTYENLPVTGIGDYAFAFDSEFSSFASIEIPASVTSIGVGTFAACNRLINITVAENNSVYKSIDGNLYSKDKSVLIQYAIGKEATEFIVPDFVTSIGVYAFAFAEKLESVTISDGVMTVEGAFYGCSSLTDITVSENNSAYKSMDGNLYSKDGSVLIQYAIGKNATGFIVPDFVTSIGVGAFACGEKLENVTISDNITTIGMEAFYYCSSVTSVVIGNGVTAIGDYAFEGCSSLTSVMIGNSVTTIGDRVFTSCSSLTSIEIPDGITTIGYDAFYGCTSLTSIEIPDSVTTIGEGIFYNCSSLTSVVIGDGVTSIGDDAFYECFSLTSVYYKGTAEEWYSIAIDISNAPLTLYATRYYYSESQPTTEGNYWYYDENGEIAVW